MIFELEPVRRDKRGKEIFDYVVRDFYEKMSEELLEAHATACDTHPQAVTEEIKELLDLMTVCATRISVILPDQMYFLSELQEEIITRNKARGYFDVDD